MMKVCTRCKESKDTSFFVKDKNRKDGFDYRCKACHKSLREPNKKKAVERAKAWREANKERSYEYHKAYMEANKEKLSEKRRAWREANKEKIAEKAKLWREANKEKISEKKKIHYEANRQKLLERHKTYRKLNKEKISETSKQYYQANKEFVCDQAKAWREANKDRVAESKARRRALKRKAIPPFLRDCEVEKERLLEVYKMRDLFTKVTGIEHHVDHMWPLADGGPHWSGNLQILTATENLSKSCKVCELTKTNIKSNLRRARKEYTS